MKALVVYDSLYGNTEQIAKVLADSLNTHALNVKDADFNTIKNLDVLVVGSPTQGGRPTELIRDFLDTIPNNSLKKVGVTTFDTRISGKDNGIGIKVLVGILGFAAGRIAQRLVQSGGNIIAEPEGFIVTGTKGPLKEGEIKRAESWADEIVKNRRDFGDEF